MADKPGNKPPPGKTPAKKPAAKKPSAKTPAKTTAPEQPPADAAPAPEKKAAYKPTGVKSSFVLVTIAGLLWGFMAGVGWAKLQDIYAEGYHTFNNAELPLLLPFLMMFFSLSLYWLIRTPRRKDVKPLAISSLLVWLIYFFWEAVLASHFGGG